jgi:DNA-binding transcriptional ArsR family regulator
MMRDLLAITNALADENRVRALAVLAHGELCVCQLIELFGLAPSTVSKHLSILRQARLIDGRKDGRWMYYRLPGDEAPTAVREALAWVTTALKGDARVREDARAIRGILKENPEDLCRRQMARCGRAGDDSACCSSAPAIPAAAKWRRGGPKNSRPTRSTPIPPGPSRTG